MGVIVAVGGIFCLIPGLVLAVLSIYTLPAVAEGRVVSPVLGREYGLEHQPLTSLLPLHSEVR